ncbi:MAG TPA: hypothetical protein PLL64_08345 [Rhodothermales bacterium]|nr:hypothetical protein [Rhodothermales bacterium]HRR08750.1 hypothetical protein [Rhodothermales bacterium]
MNDLIEGLIGIMALAIIAAIPISIFFFRYRTRKLEVEARQATNTDVAGTSLSHTELTGLIQQAVSEAVKPLQEEIRTLEHRLSSPPHQIHHPDYRDGLFDDALPEEPIHVRSLGRQSAT